MRNPKLEVGKKYKLIHSVNGYAQYDGKMFEVKTVQANGNANCRLVEDGRKTLSVYVTNAQDSFECASRKDQAESLKEILEETKKEVERLTAEIKWLEEYDSDEEATADKLAQILKDPTKENIQKVLEEMRRSDFL